MRLSELQAHARAARPDARARPAGRPDDRRVPRRRPLRAAPPPLRRDARPRDRRHRRARRRHDRELGRQGREERRRLRPRQALLRLARPARPDRARRAAAAPAPGGVGDGRRRDRRSARRSGRSCAARSSCRAPSTSCRRAGSRCSSRAVRPRSTRRSRRARASAPTTSVWDEAPRAQSGAARPRAVRPGRTACSRRPGLGHRVRRRGRASAPWSPLAERVRAAFDPDGDPRLDGCRRSSRDCVHCGFCLPTCPTYELWHEEMDSPRGRIWLMQATLDGTVELNRDGRRALRPLPRLHGLPHLVPVGRAVRPADRARPRAGRGGGAAAASRERLLRAVVVRRLPAPEAHARGAPLLALPAPGPFRPLQGARAAVARGGRAAARDAGAAATKVARVGLLTGCVQSVLFGEVNRASARVLSAYGYEVDRAVRRLLRRARAARGPPRAGPRARADAPRRVSRPPAPR